MQLVVQTLYQSLLHVGSAGYQKPVSKSFELPKPIYVSHYYEQHVVKNIFFRGDNLWNGLYEKSKLTDNFKQFKSSIKNSRTQRNKVHSVRSRT